MLYKEGRSSFWKRDLFDAIVLTAWDAAASKCKYFYLSRRYLWLCLMPSPTRGIVMTATRTVNQATTYLGINMQDVIIDIEVDGNSFRSL